MNRGPATAVLPPIADIGSFHVGGVDVRLDGMPARELTVVPGSPVLRIEQNGDFVAWQVYAQYVRLASPTCPWPVVFWHGGGMTGAAWETTPDGRPGWQRLFLEAGFDTVVSDAAERGRSGWARFPQINLDEPFFMPKGEVWRRYRIGPSEGYASEPAQRRGYPDGRFPIAAFDNYARQIVPRWTGTDRQIANGYRALLERIGPAIIIAHSQGGGFASNAALQHPDLVKALVLVEPGGVSHPQAIGDAAGPPVPTYFIWGDRTEGDAFYRDTRKRSFDAVDAIRARGGEAELLDLPALGITGNSHMIMMDDNSAEIADRTIGWLRSRVVR